MNKQLVFVLLVFAFIAMAGCVQSGFKFRDTTSIKPTSISSFQVIPNAQICTQDGKPIVRLYSTTWCPHCKWVNETFNGVMKEYMDAGKIVAMHWDVDIKDDQFTPKAEGAFPDSELQLFQQANPDGTIPTFLFGCKYYRVGNAHETENNPDAEAGEFKAVIEKLLTEVNTK